MKRTDSGVCFEADEHLRESQDLVRRNSSSTFHSPSSSRFHLGALQRIFFTKNPRLIWKWWVGPGAKTIKKNTNSTQNKSQTHCAEQYKVTSFLSTDCELSTNPCSKNVYSLGPRSHSELFFLEHRPKIALNHYSYFGVVFSICVFCLYIHC